MIAFDLGEKKHVTIEVVSRKNEEFAILEAGYELIHTSDGTVEDSGSCTVVDHTIDSLISPNKTGVYLLRYTYHIADEILIENMEVRVTNGRLKN